MITILGATGQVGGRIALMLRNSGRKLRLVARSVDELRPLVNKRTEAMAGDALDTEFLVKAFTGSDAVFTLIPPNPAAENFLGYADRIGESIARALEIAGVNHVVNLSSVGAEVPSGTGPITGLHHMEERLNRISGLNVLHLRAAFFMENLFMSMDLIRTRSIVGGALRGEMKFPMIATRDVASYAAERLLKRDFSGASVRYLLGSGDISMVEATMTIGVRIGKPNLPYVALSYEDAERGLIQAGLSPDVSRSYMEMNRAFNEGRIIVKRTPDSTTATSFQEFCQEVFVPAYMERKAA